MNGAEAVSENMHSFISPGNAISCEGCKDGTKFSPGNGACISFTIGVDFEDSSAGVPWRADTEHSSSDGIRLIFVTDARAIGENGQICDTK